MLFSYKAVDKSSTPREGTVDAQTIEAAIEAAKERAVRAILLNVSAPFHSPLMQPAVPVMSEALGNVEIAPPALQLMRLLLR